MRIVSITLMIAMPTSGFLFAQEAPVRAQGNYGWVWVEAYIGQSPPFFLQGEWFDNQNVFAGQWVRDIGWKRGNGLFRGWIYVPENDLYDFRGRVKSTYPQVFLPDAMVESSSSVSGLEKKSGWITVPPSGLIVHGHLFIPSAERDEKDRRQRELEDRRQRELDRRQRELEEDERQRREDERKVQAWIFSILIGLFVFGVLFCFSRWIVIFLNAFLPQRECEHPKEENKACEKEILPAPRKGLDLDRLATLIKAGPPPKVSFEVEPVPSEEQFYEIAFQEVAENQVLAAIWDQAFGLAKGDEQKAKAFYLKLRIEQLKRNSPPTTATHLQGNRSSSEKKTPEAKNNPMAITGFTLGLVSILLFWIGIIPLLAIVFSGIGLATFKPEIQKNKWMAGVGLALGVLYTIISITQAR